LLQIPFMPWANPIDHYGFAHSIAKKCSAPLQVVFFPLTTPLFVT